MKRSDLVNTIDQLVDDFCADDVKDALAAVCAARAVQLDNDWDAGEWRALAAHLNAIPNLGL